MKLQNEEGMLQICCIFSEVLFLRTSLDGCLCLLVLIHGHGGMRWRKVICVVKLKVIQLQPKCKIRKFQNLIRKIGQR